MGAEVIAGPSLLQAASGMFQGKLFDRVSQWLGESPEKTRRGVQDALPATMIGVAEEAAGEAGAAGLLDHLREGRYPQLDSAEDIGRALESPQATDRMVRSSEGFMGRIFGGRLGSIVDGISQHSGVSRGASSKLLSLMLPLVLGLLRKRAVSEGLDAGGLRSLLGEQKKLASSALPGGLAGLFGGRGDEAGRVVEARPVQTAPSRISEVARQVPRLAAAGPSRPGGLGRWIPWLLAAVAAILGISWLAGRGRQRREPVRRVEVPTLPVPQARAPRVEVPAAPAIPVPAAPQVAAPVSGEMGALSAYLSGAAGSGRFAFPALEFATGSTDLTAGAQSVLDQLAGVLAQYPDARVRIEGHADATGSPNANQALSQARADSVKSALTQRGVAAGRVETAAFASDRPLVAGDRAEAMAHNRRAEIVVIAR